MKKLFCLLAALLIGAVLPLGALAAQGISLTAESADELIYVTVRLTEPVQGDTLGISSSFDTALLQAVPEKCQWKPEGLLSDFDERGYGVWTKGEGMELSGDMVVLAFQPLTRDAFDADITCTLIVKSGANEVGRYTASATVTQAASDGQKPDTGWLLWVLLGIGGAAVAVGGTVMRKRHLQSR